MYLNALSPTANARIVLAYIARELSLPEGQRSASSVEYYGELASDALARFEPTQRQIYDVPLDVLALSLPSLSGGAPEAEPFCPSVDDWNDYFTHRYDDLSESDVVTVTGTF